MKHFRLTPDTFQRAQGDVILTAVQEVSYESDVNRVPTDSSVTVDSRGFKLADGEKPGHSHVLRPVSASETVKVLTQRSNAGAQTITLLEIPANGAILDHPEHGTLVIPGGITIVAMAGAAEYAPAAPTGGMSVKD